MLAIKKPPTLRTGRTRSRVVDDLGSAGVADVRDLWGAVVVGFDAGVL